MKRKLKELIEKASYELNGDYREFLVIPTGEKYRGLWGKNGYNNIIVLGKSINDNEWKRIDYGMSDVLWIRQVRDVNVDVPEEFNCVRLWFRESMHIDSQMSAITGTCT